jgi:hypothetical protein
MAKHAVPVEAMGNANKIVSWKHGGKFPLGTHQHRWEDNFKIDLEEIGCENINMINMVQDRGQL